MGYTHYWRGSTRNARDKFGLALPAIKDIVKKHRQILRYDYDSDQPPVVNEDEVRFNGIEDDGHETFSFKPVAGFEFCKTARKPYDLPVCEILLVLEWFMDGIELSSDGFWGPEPDENWPAALEAVRKYGVGFEFVRGLEGEWSLVRREVDASANAS